MGMRLEGVWTDKTFLGDHQDAGVSFEVDARGAFDCLVQAQSVSRVLPPT